jgi:hypothetical protein
MQSLQTERSLNDIIISACHGAAFGACLIAAISAIGVIFTLAMKSLTAALELISIRAGNEPRWLTNVEEDCKLEAFQNLPQCHEEPMFDLVFDVVYAIGVGTLMGMFLGAMMRPNREIVGN